MKLLFSFKGQIGRGKFFGLSILYLFIYLLVIAYTSDLVIILSFFIYIFINITLAVKRLRDINYSPWLALVYIIPFAGIPIYIMLVFIKGKKKIIKTINVAEPKRVYKDHEIDKPIIQLTDIQNNVFRILEDSISNHKMSS